LLRILCFERFGIDPDFQPMPPDPVQMLRRCDAALLIGDPALFLDHDRLGTEKIDLGEQWKALTGLPFVWAVWAGRRDALRPEAVTALVAARDNGVARSDEVAAAYCGSERAQRGQSYLRENIQYTLGEREESGLVKYYELAQRTGVVNALVPPLFY
jgi:chorismate dehydratase